jgi:uncharacterized membrane protein YesL
MRSQHTDLHQTDRSLDEWLTPVMANLLWVALSIPLITLPMATAALFATMFYWTRGKRPEAFNVFLDTMRRCWLKSTLVALLDLIVGGLVVVNLSIFQMMDMTQALAFISRSVTLFIGVLLVLVNVYVWPLLAVWDVPLRRLLEFALQLVFAHPLWSLGIAAAALLRLVVASVILPAAALLLGGVAFTAYVACKGAWFIAQQYLSMEDLSL